MLAEDMRLVGQRQGDFITHSIPCIMGFIFTLIHSASKSQEGDTVVQVEASNAVALLHNWGIQRLSVPNLL